MGEAKLRGGNGSVVAADALHVGPARETIEDRRFA
jgi:hypothetical protein